MPLIKKTKRKQSEAQIKKKIRKDIIQLKKDIGKTGFTKKQTLALFLSGGIAFPLLETKSARAFRLIREKRKRLLRKSRTKRRRRR